MGAAYFMGIRRKIERFLTPVDNPAEPRRGGNSEERCHFGMPTISA
jgi:hypothetical protein